MGAAASTIDGEDGFSMLRFVEQDSAGNVVASLLDDNAGRTQIVERGHQLREELSSLRTLLQDHLHSLSEGTTSEEEWTEMLSQLLVHTGEENTDATDCMKSLTAIEANDSTLKQTPTCCVCMEKLEKSHLYLQLPCGHIFHAPCIKSCIRRSFSCPMCRFVYTPECGKG